MKRSATSVTIALVPYASGSRWEIENAVTGHVMGSAKTFDEIVSKAKARGYHITNEAQARHLIVNERGSVVDDRAEAAAELLRAASVRRKRVLALPARAERNPGSAAPRRRSVRNSAEKPSRAPSASAIYDLISPHAKHDGRTFTRADAESLREAMSEAAERGGDFVQSVLVRFNRALDAHGVEAISRADGRWVDRYFGDTKLLYVNMGDPYIATVIYNVARRAFAIRPWGGGE